MSSRPARVDGSVSRTIRSLRSLASCRRGAFQNGDWQTSDTRRRPWEKGVIGVRAHPHCAFLSELMTVRAVRAVRRVHGPRDRAHQGQRTLPVFSTTPKAFWVRPSRERADGQARVRTRRPQGRGRPSGAQPGRGPHWLPPGCIRGNCGRRSRPSSPHVVRHG
jgi:hypothetical protein